MELGEVQLEQGEVLTYSPDRTAILARGGKQPRPILSELASTENGVLIDFNNGACLAWILEENQVKVVQMEAIQNGRVILLFDSGTGELVEMVYYDKKAGEWKSKEGVVPQFADSFDKIPAEVIPSDQILELKHQIAITLNEKALQEAGNNPAELPTKAKEVEVDYAGYFEKDGQEFAIITVEGQDYLFLAQPTKTGVDLKRVSLIPSATQRRTLKGKVLKQIDSKQLRPDLQGRWTEGQTYFWVETPSMDDVISTLTEKGGIFTFEGGVGIKRESGSVGCQFTKNAITGEISLDSCTIPPELRAPELTPTPEPLYDPNAPLEVQVEQWLARVDLSELDQNDKEVVLRAFRNWLPKMVKADDPQVREVAQWILEFRWFGYDENHDRLGYYHVCDPNNGLCLLKDDFKAWTKWYRDNFGEGADEIFFLGNAFKESSTSHNWSLRLKNRVPCRQAEIEDFQKAQYVLKWMSTQVSSPGLLAAIKHRIERYEELIANPPC